MLTIQGLSYRYGRRGAPVLNGVNLTLARGEIGILLGRNGSGKTTLFRNILGLCTPDSGSIRLDGLEMTSLSPRRRARYIACVPQDICFGALTVFEPHESLTFVVFSPPFKTISASLSEGKFESLPIESAIL